MSISEVLCKFGDSCTKANHGKCPYKHSENGPNKINQIACPYGDKCKFYKEGKCKYIHSNDEDKAKNEYNAKKQGDISMPHFSNNAMPPKRSPLNPNSVEVKVIKSQHPPGPHVHQQIISFENEILCKEFAANSCNKGTHCELSHSFTPEENIIKRIFSYSANGNETIKSFSHPNIFSVHGEWFLATIFNNMFIGIFEMDAKFSILRNVCQSSF